MPLSFEGPVCAKLRPYRCQALDPKTGYRCRTILIDAWAPAGAVVKRRCKKCGVWATIVVEAAEPTSVPAESERRAAQNADNPALLIPHA